MSRFAVFMHVLTAKQAKAITWISDNAGLWIKVTNPKGDTCIYPMTDYNSRILERAGRKLGDGCYR